MWQQYSNCTEQFFHVCLPMTMVNGVSCIQPEWTATGGSILVGRGRKNRPTIRGRVMPDSLPQPVEEHYRTKMAVYLH